MEKCCWTASSLAPRRRGVGGVEDEGARAGRERGEQHSPDGLCALAEVLESAHLDACGPAVLGGEVEERYVTTGGRNVVGAGFADMTLELGRTASANYHDSIHRAT